MGDLISKGELFNALCNVSDKAEAFAVIQDMPTKEAVPIERLAREYYVMDDIGYTNREVVKKLNEVIAVVNLLEEEMKWLMK